MGYEFIKYDKEGHVVTITINRPDTMNAIHPATQLELNDAFDTFADDSNAWVAILTGAGEKAFSAGNDLKWQAEHGWDAVAEVMAKLEKGFAGLARRRDCYKPMIAAVNGFALGGGFEMALACDVIVASENARFGLPEPRVGLMAAAGGVHRLPRHVPHHVAMGMILTGKMISADEAHRIGLVNEVVPAPKLLACAKQWTADILACAPLSVQAAKQTSQYGLEMSLDQALESKFPMAERMEASTDYVEGPLAFAEKRPPQWSGR